jgi:hypothetical protein
MSPNRHHLVRFLVPVVCLGFVLGAVGCGDDDGDESVTTSAPVTEPTTEDTAAEVDEVVAVATALCGAYGEVEEAGGVDALLELMADDVQVTDSQLGATLTGTEQVRAYVTGDLFAGIDSSECGVTVHRGGWVAGSYTLSNSTTGEAGQGIAAIHVTDGKVDRQINHYTSVSADPESPPTATVADSDVEAYCQAWDDGADPDEVTSFMAPDVQLVIIEPVVGLEAVRAYVEGEFPFDGVDCGDEAVEFGEWSALAAGFSDSASGLSAGGVNVVRFDEQGQVVAHFVYVDPGA